MTETDELLARWQTSRCPNISVGGLVAKNPIAHKWKATYRSLLLRECVFWRTHDLVEQSHVLFTNGHVLGSLVLLRSALESVAMLIYLNQSMKRVIDGQLGFHEFSEKTTQLIMGSRNQSTKHQSVNVLTAIEQADKKYQGLLDAYKSLSECAHPNYEGLCFGYSRVDFDKAETNFSNNWHAMWAAKQPSLMTVITRVFEIEYDKIWPPLMDELETWLVQHDAELEATKQGA